MTEVFCPHCGNGGLLGQVPRASCCTDVVITTSINWLGQVDKATDTSISIGYSRGGTPVPWTQQLGRLDFYLHPKL